ncbi:hypothetical protein OG21DRAFT_1261292 [Imleria badia]|nr:hypothetical protein OG21DRAFT_1261292 [Imleria badia]
MAMAICVVAVILLTRPLLKSSTAAKHSSSNAGLMHIDPSSAFSAADWADAVPEDSPVIPGLVTPDIVPDSFLVRVIDDGLISQTWVARKFGARETTKNEQRDKSMRGAPRARGASCDHVSRSRRADVLDPLNVRRRHYHGQNKFPTDILRSVDLLKEQKSRPRGQWEKRERDSGHIPRSPRYSRPVAEPTRRRGGPWPWTVWGSGMNGSAASAQHR